VLNIAIMIGYLAWSSKKVHNSFLLTLAQ
jgi:hypothetical protein